MRSKKFWITVLFCLSVSYAQSDSTVSAANKNSKPQSEIAKISNNTPKQLEKRTVVRKDLTTWTKIKDLFM
ncbi:MAG: hypothetical protein GX640_02005 [Fibrobacter sp.]|nr:hypothetical protein [Fibrobacter sp.]